ncbi:MAG: hypothetical protein A2Y12_10945 [Planctomycetes bacterium GWF2_42_9]|nr:MAG: hypothetical protein A2Y12_10945 [Planctomycetes bacterium GWF2_42_9]
MIKFFLIAFLPLCTANLQIGKTNPKPLSDQQQWALGVSGLLAARNNMRFDSLEGEEINKFTVQMQKDSLKKWWGIETKADLLKDLKWLEDEGHSENFAELKETLDYFEDNPGPTTELSNFLQKIKNDWEYICKIMIVTKYQEYLGDKSLYGWDAARYVCLCRWGYTCGYLTEEEAWEKIMPAARFVQRTFDSWEDFGANYIIGREFWSPKDDDRYMYEDAYMRLLEMPDSPWKKLPWNLYLGEEK